MSGSMRDSTPLRSVIAQTLPTPVAMRPSPSATAILSVAVDLQRLHIDARDRAVAAERHPHAVERDDKRGAGLRADGDGLRRGCCPWRRRARPCRPRDSGPTPRRLIRPLRARAPRDHGVGVQPREAGSQPGGGGAAGREFCAPGRLATVPRAEHQERKPLAESCEGIILNAPCPHTSLRSGLRAGFAGDGLASLLVGAVLRAAQTPAPRQQRPSRKTRPVRDEDPAAARGQLLRLPRRIGDGRPARRFARRAAARRRDRTGHRARQSGRRARCSRPCSTPTASRDAARPRQAAAADIDALAEWIRGGAVWPASTETRAGAGRLARARRSRRSSARSGRSSRFANPPCRPCRDAAWPRTDIDRFVLARLEREGLSPVAAADKLTLLRRATLDLTGLPPTPEEVDAFLADASPDAFAKVVDRLLASPRYGEAWGRMWLDVARYGEDDYRSLDPMGRGFNPYPNAHLYRDWVIRAFNDDLPYDQFVTAQLAADLLDGPRSRAASAGARLPRPRPVVLRQRRRRDHARRRAPRSRRRGQPRLSRPHRRLRALPRSQVRPDSDQGLLRARRRLPQHRVHEYPLAPKAVVDDYKAKEKQLKQKREMLDEFTATESRQLAETLAFQASKYMKAAWQVTGEPKKDKLRDRRQREARLRAVRSLAAVPREAAGVLSVPQGLAGADRARRHGEGSRRRSPTSSRSCWSAWCSSSARSRKRTTSSGRGRCRPASRRSRPTCPTSSRPTTTSVRAAGSSCAA